MIQVVFDTKTGVIGKKRLATKKEEEQLHCNYVVKILDGITFETVATVAYISNEYKWRPLPDNDERVQFVRLFDILYGAEWYFNIAGTDENAEVEEYYLEDEHKVFERIRKLFRR